MPVLKLEETADSDWAILPVDSIIDVEVEDISDREVPGRDGKEGWVKLEFKFLIKGVPTHLEAEYGSLVGSRIWGSVSKRLSTHPDNKLRQWAESLLNMGEFPTGFELDTDMLIGRRARAVIVQYKKRDGSFNHQVGGLLPVATTPSTPAGADPWSSAAPSPTFTDEPPF